MPSNQGKDAVSISFLTGNDTLVFKKTPESRVFITTTDSLIIGRETLITLINYLVKNEIVSPKALQGILEEYNTN